MSGSLAADLGMGDALAGIESRHGGLVADACRKTARTIVRNAAESVEHQVGQAEPRLKRFKCPLGIIFTG